MAADVVEPFQRPAELDRARTVLWAMAKAPTSSIRAALREMDMEDRDSFDLYGSSTILYLLLVFDLSKKPVPSKEELSKLRITISDGGFHEETQSMDPLDPSPSWPWFEGPDHEWRLHPYATYSLHFWPYNLSQTLKEFEKHPRRKFSK
jgi:hypothetical protein